MAIAIVPVDTKTLFYFGLGMWFFIGVIIFFYDEIFKLLSSLSPKEQTFGLLVMIAVMAGVTLPHHFNVSISDSLDKRIYFISRFNNNADIKIGDYLVFQGEAEHVVFAKPQVSSKSAKNRIIKRVGCAPGQKLEYDGNGDFTCDGKFLGQALKADSLGRPLPQFDFSGIVPAGSYFMVGDDPRSFDSKYFGFIHADQMLYKALPLL